MRVSWIVAPWVLALWLLPNPLAMLRETPFSCLQWSYLFGLLWGIGGLTFGLSVRYLGMSLGYAVALGWCAVFGTVVPPIVNGEFVTQVLHATSGQFVLLGLCVCIGGIVFAGLAGMAKEKDLSDVAKTNGVREFNFAKGLLVATFAGIMSSCMSLGLAAGEPLKQIAVAHGANPLWQGLPVLIVVLFGGFTTNFLWCLVLHIRNRSGGQYFSSFALIDRADDSEPPVRNNEERPFARVPLLVKYFFSALAGTTWYLQFFCYTMGESQMDVYRFSSWTIHMASIIVFSTLWGVALKEWRGTNVRSRRLLGVGSALLLCATLIVGYGNYRGRKRPPAPEQQNAAMSRRHAVTSRIANLFPAHHSPPTLV